VNGAAIGPVFALDQQACAAATLHVHKTCPISRVRPAPRVEWSTRWGITGITWGRAAADDGPIPRTRDQAPQLW
jgi:hypothetical protein